MTTLLRTSALLAAAGLLLALTACSGGGPTAAGGLVAAPLTPPPGEVVGTGTVLDIDGSAQFCLGPVAESAPPQCAGIPLEDWSWEGVEGFAEAGDARWGAYALQGTFDGQSFIVTAPPILLALYDPMMREDPTGGVPGTGSAQELETAAGQLPAALGDALLSTVIQDGYVWANVVWDDGTLQDAADAEHGAGVVIITSALLPVTSG